MDLAVQQREAMLAATQAVSASNALLTFHMEGPEGTRPWMLADPIAELAEALARAIDIDAPSLEGLPSEFARTERSANGQLRAAIRKWQSDTGAGVT